MIRTLLTLTLFATSVCAQEFWQRDGHTYGQIQTSFPMSWPQAKLFAESYHLGGQPGHLATFTSAEELEFVTENYDGQRLSWIGLTDDPEFGGTESALEPNPKVDGWVWVTGEPLTYTNWISAANPDNRNGAENFVVMANGRVAGGWNDVIGELQWHLIEFDAAVEALPLDDFDLNNDGIINPIDVDAFVARTITSSTDTQYDLNEDGIVNLTDVEALLQELGIPRGDADMDGTVGFTDFLQVSANFGNVAGWGGGDFNGSFDVSFNDFLFVSNNFGLTATETIAVPEPTGNTLMLAMLVLLAAASPRASKSRNG